MKSILLIWFAFPWISSKCQDERLIEKVSFVPPDSIVQAIEKTVPAIKLALSSVNFYRITYLSDGLKVKGYLAVPKKQGNYPCVIYNRGGNKEYGKLPDKIFTRDLSEISSKGYVIIASQYRGNDGGEGQEEFGGKDVDDVLNLIPVLSQVPSADTSQIGMFGWSRGGMMTYIALAKTTKIKAAVVGSGVTDLIKALETRPEFDTTVYPGLIPNYASNKMTHLKERSAVYFADKINKTTPILILQGTADWRVPTNQVLDLVNKFYQLKQPFRFILYEGGDHGLTEHRNDYMTQIINWFNAYLRDKKTWPSLELHGN